MVYKIKALYRWFISNELALIALLTVNVATCSKFFFAMFAVPVYWWPVFIVVGGLTGFIFGLIPYFIVIGCQVVTRQIKKTYQSRILQQRLSQRSLKEK